MWMKADLYILLEEKKFSFLRAEELETTLKERQQNLELEEREVKLEGYRMAAECARNALSQKVLDNKDDPEKFKSDLMNIAMTTWSSKILSQDKEHFAKLAGDAVLGLKGYDHNIGIESQSQPESTNRLMEARNQGLELSCSCYHALLNLLVEDGNSDLAIRLYMDMMESEFGSCAEDRQLNFVVGSLSKNGKTIEAVNILRRTRTAGVKASPTIIDTVVQGYCCKKNYEDVLNFMKEWAHIPSSSVGNKVVSSIFKKFGSDYAWFFTQELNALGFQLDDISFGILIVQSCKERKLRVAFIYFSESFSYRIKLNVHTYNAIIGGVLKEGMCKAAKNIFEEMLRESLIYLI